jgi:lipid II:glycine glycyltransferase (peptidoglycan interpeptide bridge formation enzyme)
MKYTDIRQSPQFARFMQDLGWRAEKIDNIYIYLRKFPFLGYFAKIPRPSRLINLSLIKSLHKKYRIFKLKIAPFAEKDKRKFKQFRNRYLRYGFRVEQSPFNPTTTIQINLTPPEEEIFKSFSEAKRRAVRRAMKNNIYVKTVDSIKPFINIRKKQYAPFGFLVTGEMQKLWTNFYPQNASLLLAFQSHPVDLNNDNQIHIHAIASKCFEKPLAGILLLYYHKVAYYWLASALTEGKKLFAPTFLVWEAIKLSKKRGCKILDFEGVYDDRFPKASESWKGFTKFKEGFGGKTVVYLENFTK